MAHKIGSSGSVILSDSAKFDELFWENCNHIEIGEFANREDFLKFMEKNKEKGYSLGIHLPLYRDNSKYDLIQEVSFTTEEAWAQLDAETKFLSGIGVEYVLVHFPYFTERVPGDPSEIIEKGLRKISDIQKKHGIPIVCEPKLGPAKSPVGIDYLDRFPVEVWDKYGIKLCIDIGDYLMAAGNKVMEYLEKWKPYIKVVHLHNVEYHGDKYIWVPVHPGHEADGSHFNVQKVIEFLGGCKEVYFIFEHTPHSKPSQQFVYEGVEWVKKLILINE
ncbi:sugar phosphate isomerase/epimerase family protein [Pseudalkalibacillus caeni]|uniref:Sugar phosphate isomerase/epimerase n=1 Tax=Exobacillus caeni TaxID=2574798 RepID=A0A5R9F554_9BACL|nr:TIM barrel protein [Pseudalkalibacillus caeni]TLS38872.1 sugar phosphate isomerase/epimerase [Pseudalkalibacillus caeni]